MKTDEPVYVRYVYLTEKCLRLLESLEKVTDEIDLQKIPKDQELPPLPRVSKKPFKPDRSVLSAVVEEFKKEV